jgi:hypothetical protein
MPTCVDTYAWKDYGLAASLDKKIIEKVAKGYRIAIA